VVVVRVAADPVAATVEATGRMAQSSFRAMSLRVERHTSREPRGNHAATMPQPRGKLNSEPLRQPEQTTEQTT
jgi:hypothetical protein